MKSPKASAEHEALPKDASEKQKIASSNDDVDEIHEID
jgi:hypothetical protein